MGLICKSLLCALNLISRNERHIAVFRREITNLSFSFARFSIIDGTVTKITFLHLKSYKLERFI